MYRVWCYDDYDEGEVPQYILATSRVFNSKDEAYRYASTISPSRMAVVSTIVELEIFEDVRTQLSTAIAVKKISTSFGGIIDSAMNKILSKLEEGEHKIKLHFKNPNKKGD